MSIFDHPESVPTAPTWRCPHCRMLQPETSRCRACSRAAVACSSCHLFRAAVATDLGYCAMDPGRMPLSGDEVRPCWEAAPMVDVAAGLFDGLDQPPAAVVDATARERHPPRAATPGSAPGRFLPFAVPVQQRPSDRLVDAPQVPPGRELISELQRRLRDHGEG